MNGLAVKAADTTLNVSSSGVKVNYGTGLILGATGTNDAGKLIVNTSAI